MTDYMALIEDIEWLDRWFWSKIDVRGPDDCWLWTKGCNSSGYGLCPIPQRYSGKGKGYHCRAHRLSWAIANKKPPPLGLGILHNCDNPPCQNYRHLRVGSHAENMADMALRGRSNRLPHAPETILKGESHPGAKISAREAILIQQMYDDGGISYGKLGLAFGLAPGSIRDIVKGRNWKSERAP